MTTTTSPPFPTIVHSERYGSRRGSWDVDASSEIDYVYTLRGSDDVVSMVAYLDTIAPTYIDDPIYPGVSSRRLWRGPCTWSQIAPQAWEFIFTYIDGRKMDEMQPPETGDFRISGSTTGGTAKILCSKQTIAGHGKYGSGTPGAGFALAAIPDFGQAIGVTREGEVQGVEIVVPAQKFTIEYTQPLAVITVSYSKLVEELTGRVNSAEFFGRPAGEVLSLGVDYSQGTKSDPTCAYHFLRLPNILGMTIGELTGINKLGHEYLWVYFEEQPDPNANNRPVKQPKYAYVERVYDFANFSSFGIGTG